MLECFLRKGSTYLKACMVTSSLVFVSLSGASYAGGDGPVIPTSSVVSNVEYIEQFRVKDERLKNIQSIKRNRLFSGEALYVKTESQLLIYRVKTKQRASESEEPELLAVLDTPPSLSSDYEIINNEACQLLVAGRCLLSFNKMTNTLDMFRLTYSGDTGSEKNFQLSEPVTLEPTYDVNSIYAKDYLLLDRGNYTTPPRILAIKDGKTLEPVQTLDISEHEYGSEFLLTRMLRGVRSNVTSLALLTDNGSAYVFEQQDKLWVKKGETLFWSSLSNTGAIAFAKPQGPQHEAPPYLMTVTKPSSKTDSFETQVISKMSGPTYDGNSLNGIMRNPSQRLTDVVLGGTDMQVRGRKMFIPIQPAPLGIKVVPAPRIAPVMVYYIDDAGNLDVIAQNNTHLYRWEDETDYDAKPSLFYAIDYSGDVIYIVAEGEFVTYEKTHIEKD